MPALAVGVGRAQAAAPEIIIYKTPYCTCCGGWVSHLQKAGFKTTVNLVEDLTPIRARYGVPARLASCHTGVIAGYVVEGHVPAADVIRLVKERPKALGILVPGMPFGSPGMEAPAGAKSERFQTLLLLDKAGRTQVFATHG